VGLLVRQTTDPPRQLCCPTDGVASEGDPLEITVIAETEANHFGNCPVCWAYIDMRDLDQMLAHADIEIGEGPCPPERRTN